VLFVPTRQTQQGALDALEAIHISRSGAANKCLQSGAGADTGNSFTLDQVGGGGGCIEGFVVGRERGERLYCGLLACSFH
jgi:hypothetical protein